MEALIFGAVSLFMLSLFVVLPVLAAYLVYRIGSRSRKNVLRWVLPLLVLGLPVGWAAAGYAVYKQECTTMPGPAFVEGGQLADHVEPASLERPITDFVVMKLPLEPVASWWGAPISRQRMQAAERKTGRVFAEATDLVFGGGLLSWYMKLIGGDQDYQYLSCGYASADIGPWRPSLSSRPRDKQYRDADTALMDRAANPTIQRTPRALTVPTR
jgi:hypothetical protein